ncbi:MAG: hypothetical protein KF767_14190 [Bdellovibrionaceae bacterium]|nr:hypothetical protein [Pseudobdellovibrionaceae bacterium]
MFFRAAHLLSSLPAMTFAVLLFTGLAPQNLWAEARCAVIHEPLTDLIQGRRPPTLDEALRIVGDELAPKQVRRALEHVLKMPNVYEARVQALEQLFQAIRQLQYFTWKFEKFTGPDREVGYVGDQGYFVLLKRDGRILKGMFRLERDLNDYGEWNGHADEIVEVRPAATNP